MKNYIKGIFNNHSLLFKYILTYLIIFLLPLFIFGYFSFDSAVRQLNDQVETTYIEKIKQIAYDIDNQYRDLQLTSIRMASNRLLQPYIMKKNTFNEMQAIEELKKYKEKSELIEECILYFKGDKEVYTAEGKYTAGFFTDGVLKYQDSNILEELNQAITPYIKKQQVIRFDNSFKSAAITFIFPFSAGYTVNKNAVAVFVIKHQAYLNRISHLIGKPEGEIFIFENYTEEPVFYSYNADNIGKEFNQKSLKKFMRNQSKNYERIKQKSKNYTLLKAISPEEKFSCFYIVPTFKLLERTNQLRGIIGKILILVIILGIILAFIFAYNNYHPVREIVEKIKELKPLAIDDKVKNELGNISSIIENTIDTNKNLRVKVDEQNKIIKNQLIYSLFQGNYNCKIKKRIKRLNLKLDGPCYSVFILSILQQNNKEYIYKDYVLKILETYFSNQGIAYGVELVKEGYLGLICNINEDSITLKENLAKEIMELLRDNNISVKIGMGSICQDLKEINYSYIEGLSAVEANLENQQSIISFNKIYEDVKGYIWYPKEQLLRFAQSIKQGDKQVAIENFNTMIKEVCKKKNSKIMSNYIYYDIFNTFIKAASQNNVELDAHEVKMLSSYKNTDEIIDKMNRLIGKVCKQIVKKRDSEHQDLIEKIIAYVDENYSDYDIGLSRLAEEFDLSIYYISKVFKDSMGIGFKDYVTKLRIDKGKKLLTDTRLTIKEISKKTGYSSSSYFSRVFKSQEGMTPGQYRENV